MFLFPLLNIQLIVLSFELEGRTSLIVFDTEIIYTSNNLTYIGATVLLALVLGQGELRGHFFLQISMK